MEELVASYGNSLLRMCFMYLKDMQLAEDAVQETYLRVFKNYSQFNGEAKEKTWVMRIAINVCKDILRSAWWRKVDVTELLAEVPCEDTHHADDTVLEAVMSLQPRYKEVILLFYYQDMKISEIALALNAPENTISVRLKRAREILKKQLKGWYFDE